MVAGTPQKFFSSCLLEYMVMNLTQFYIISEEYFFCVGISVQITFCKYDLHYVSNEC